MTKTLKLTDLDLVLLSGAAGRDDGMVLPPPETVRTRGNTLEKALAKLLRHGLIEECKAEAPDQIWRQEEGRGIALRITAAGRGALGLGASAIAGEAESARAVRSTIAPVANPATSPARPGIRPGTKQARLVALLEAEKGAEIGDLVSSLGWQPHTVRAAITGLRKKGYVIAIEKSADGETIYSASLPITAADDAA